MDMVAEEWTEVNIVKFKFPEYLFSVETEKYCFFYMKLWKNHVWIYISNFMIFFPWNNKDMTILTFVFFSFRT